MALDPRKQFGNLGATAMQAPKAASLSPIETIQGATIVAQAHAQMGNTLQESLETIRRASMTTEQQRMQSMAAELDKNEAQIRLDIDKEQVDRGQLFTPEQLQTTYSTKLDEAKRNLKDKYTFDFLADEAEQSYEVWKDKTVSHFTRSVVQPRVAENNKQDLQNEARSHQEAASTRLASGDYVGALESFRNAASVMDKPNAAIAFDPMQRQAFKDKTKQDGFTDVLMTIPAKERLDMINNHKALVAGAAESGDPTVAAMSPLRGADPMWVERMARIAEQDIAVEVREQAHAAREAQARVDDKFQFDTITAIRGAEVAMDRKSLRKLEVQLADMQARNMTEGVGAGRASVNAVTSLMDNIYSAQDSILRKQEAAAEKAAKAAEKNRMLNVFNNSKLGVPLEDSEMKKTANEAFDLYATTIAKMPQPQQVEAIGEWIKAKRFVPDQVKQNVEGLIRSDDPNLAAQGAARMKAIINIDPSLRTQFSKEAEFVYERTSRGSASVVQARQEFRENGKRSPDETERLKAEARKLLKDNDAVSRIADAIPGKSRFAFWSDAPGTPDASGGSGVMDRQPDPQNFAPVPAQLKSDYASAFEQGYLIHNDERAAEEYAKQQVSSKWTITNSTGEPTYRRGQPQSFGIPDDHVRLDVAAKLTSMGLPEDNKYLLEPVGTSRTEGTPIYKLRVLNSDGVYVYTKDAAGDDELMTFSANAPAAKPPQVDPLGTQHFMFP